MPEENDKTSGNKGLTFMAIGAFVVFLSLLVFTLYKFPPGFLDKLQKTDRLPTDSGGEEINDVGFPEENLQVPTLSPEREKIISELENHVIIIENGSFSPQNLTIKAHDQVEWKNQDSETHKIKGDNWGNVPIENGQSFTQSFETPGAYQYSCSLHPEMTGTIIVK